MIAGRIASKLALAIFALAAAPAFAHRLDEYLQATLISLDKDRLGAQMTLTPGVAVFPFVIADVDADRDGVVSEAERSAYAARVLRDLSLRSDGISVTPLLTSIRFPTIDEMKEGRGEIELRFSAELPPGGRKRQLTIENHHRNGISAYLVNCLMPRDPNIQILAQNRNYSQSVYQLEYLRTDVLAGSPALRLWSGGMVWLGPLGLLLFARLFLLRRQRDA